MISNGSSTKLYAPSIKRSSEIEQEDLVQLVSREETWVEQDIRDDVHLRLHNRVKSSKVLNTEGMAVLFMVEARCIYEGGIGTDILLLLAVVDPPMNLLI